MENVGSYDSLPFNCAPFQVSGGYYVDCVEAPPAPQARDMEAAARLWELTDRMVEDTKMWFQMSGWWRTPRCHQNLAQAWRKANTCWLFSIFTIKTQTYIILSKNHQLKRKCMQTCTHTLCKCGCFLLVPVENKESGRERQCIKTKVPISRCHIMYELIGVVFFFYITIVQRNIDLTSLWPFTTCLRLACIRLS